MGVRAVPVLPGRNKVLAASSIFVCSSVLLLLEFTSLHCQWPFGYSYSFGNEVDALGVVSDLGWFFGFALIIDWLVFSFFPVYGASRRALIGATLKLTASLFFCVGPFSDLAGYLHSFTGTPLEHYGGVPWSNFVGVLFFHVGNLIDALCSGKAIRWRAFFSLQNVPPLAHVVYMAATWLLLVASTIDYIGTEEPWGPGVDVGGADKFVPYGQIAGASLLLVGSLMFVCWSYALSGLKLQPEPLMAVDPLIATETQ